MRSRLASALLLAGAVALLVAGAMVARAASWPQELSFNAACPPPALHDPAVCGAASSIEPKLAR